MHENTLEAIFYDVAAIVEGAKLLGTSQPHTKSNKYDQIRNFINTRNDSLVSILDCIRSTLCLQYEQSWMHQVIDIFFIVSVVLNYFEYHQVSNIICTSVGN